MKIRMEGAPHRYHEDHIAVEKAWDELAKK